MLFALAAVVFGLIAASVVLVNLVSRRKIEVKQLPRFPGPDKLPWIGSAHKLPLYGSAFQFKLWTDKYGPICETTLFGQRLMIISSEKIIRHLFVDNGKVFSGRPTTPAVKDAQSNFHASEYLPLMSFNEDHHRHKKVGNRVMTSSQAKNNFNLPVLESRRLMYQFLMASSSGPTDKWIRETEGYTSRILAKLSFGSFAHADRLHALTWELLVWVSPNGVLPNLLPFVDRLPFYLSPWKMVEWYRHHNQQKWFTNLLEETRQKSQSGEAPPSFMLDHIQAIANATPTYPSNEDAAKAIGMIATAGIFTVSGPLQNVIRALVCFPDWQKILQKEMDEVVPLPNLPTMEDLAKLPLLRAFIKETTRWRQAIPAGVPHENDATYEYEGIVIEKGTAIFACEYGVSRDPEVYDHPYDFDPMRWLDPKSRNYEEVTAKNPTIIGTPMFGWGRRYCMGHELARDEIYAFAAHVVWAFNVSTPDLGKMDVNLLPGEKRGGYQWPKSWRESLIIMKPEAIAVDFIIRDENRAELLRAFNVE